MKDFLAILASFHHALHVTSNRVFPSGNLIRDFFHSTLRRSDASKNRRIDADLSPRTDSF